MYFSGYLTDSNKNHYNAMQPAKWPPHRRNGQSKPLNIRQAPQRPYTQTRTNFSCAKMKEQTKEMGCVAGWTMGYAYPPQKAYYTVCGSSLEERICCVEDDGTGSVSNGDVYAGFLGEWL